MNFRGRFIRNVFPILGITIGFLGISATIYTHFAETPKREPVFVINPTRYWILRAQKLSQSSIKVIRIADNTEIKQDVTAVMLYFWNRGKKSIKRENILGINPDRRRIYISLDDPEGEIIDYRVLGRSRDVTCFEMMSDPDNPKQSVAIDFSILEHNDGATCQVIYIGDPESKIIVSGSIEGVDEIRDIRSIHRAAFFSTFNLGLKYVLISALTMIVGAVLIALLVVFILMSPSESEDDTKMTLIETAKYIAKHMAAKLKESLPFIVVFSIAIILITIIFLGIIAEYSAQKSTIYAVPENILTERMRAILRDEELDENSASNRSLQK